MAELRAAFESMGHTDVATYIQSGNVVFTSARAVKTAGAIEAQLAKALDLKTAVVLRTAADLAEVIDRNPYLDAEAKPTTLHVTFLETAPTEAVLARVDLASFAPEEFAVRTRDVYMHLPDGIGRSKLAPALTRQLGPEATTRNWNTVKKLAAMTAR